LKYFGMYILGLLDPSAPSSGVSNAGGDERLQFLLKQCSSMKPEVCSGPLKNSTTND